MILKNGHCFFSLNRDINSENICICEEETCHNKTEGCNIFFMEITFISALSTPLHISPLHFPMKENYQKRLDTSVSQKQFVIPSDKTARAAILCRKKHKCYHSFLCGITVEVFWMSLQNSLNVMVIPAELLFVTQNDTCVNIRSHKSLLV